MLKYKGKDVVAPPNNTKYIPVKVYSGAQESNMAITDIQVVEDTPYCKIEEDVFLWDYIQKVQKTLTADNYKMMNVYPDIYKTMVSVPDILDVSGFASLEGMFSETKADMEVTEENWRSLLNDYGKLTIDETHTISPYQPIEGNNMTQSADGGCRELINAPMMDTSAITSMKNMFGQYREYACGTVWDKTARRWIPLYFYYTNSCVKLERIPQYDTSNVTNFQGMFAYCTSLNDVPELDMSKAENVSGMFQGCTSLPKVFPWTIDMPLPDGYANINSYIHMFEGASVEEVTFAYSPSFVDDNGNEFYMTPELLDSTGTIKKINFVHS